jgi:peptidoglycan/xylan/chitin deacetylase (PgdA/CDA1 family)
MSEGLAYLDTEDLRVLNDRGHELGCHTFSHGRAPELRSDAFRKESETNQNFISSVCGDVRLSNFAWPFGDVSPARKAQAQRRYASCRGISPGVNSGVADLGLLKAVALYECTWDEAAIDRWFEQAKAAYGWLIFYTHDVDTQPTRHGASIEVLRRVIDKAIGNGCEILTVRNALGRLAFDQ